jgi:glycerol-3-phosphate acyltransferase PlsY
MRRWAVLGVAAGAGYLAGSVSFSRLLGRWRAPGKDLSRTEVLVPQTGQTVTLGGTTPTSVAQHLGGRWAAVAVALEAAKAALPTLAARRLAPATPAAEVAAAAAVLGHAYPVWQRGREGGYGESPMLGGLLVLDPLGFLVTNAALAAAMGLTRDARLVMAYPLTIPVWAAARHDRVLLGYALVVNAVMWSRVVPEWRTSLAGVVSRH